MSWLSSSEIVRKVKRNGGMKTRQSFAGVYPIDKLPQFVSQHPIFMIVNTRTHNLEGEHWICVFINEERQGEVFDSLAQAPNTMSTRWLNRFTRRWKRNECSYQNPLSPNCGAYVLYYCLNRLNFPSFHHVLQTLTHDPLINDQLVLGFYKTLE